MDEMPLTREGFESGEICPDKVTILTRAFESHPEAFAEAEEMLVAFVPQLSVADFRRAVTHWRHLADQELANRDFMDQRDRSFLHLSSSWGGMVHIDGRLDPESGAIVMQAVAAATSAAERAAAATTRAGGRVEPAAQRRAHALVDLCRRSLDTGTTVVGGGRPTSTSSSTTRPSPDGQVPPVSCPRPRPSPPKPHAASPATPTSPGSSPDPAPNRSMSAGPVAPSPPPSARPSPSATGAVPSRTATGPPNGATAITSSTGRTEAAPTSTTWCSSAVATTPCATRAASGPAPTAPSPDPTDPLSMTDRRSSEPELLHPPSGRARHPVRL